MPRIKITAKNRELCAFMDDALKHLDVRKNLPELGPIGKRIMIGPMENTYSECMEGHSEYHAMDLSAIYSIIEHLKGGETKAAQSHDEIAWRKQALHAWSLYKAAMVQFSLAGKDRPLQQAWWLAKTDEATFWDTFWKWKMEPNGAGETNQAAVVTMLISKVIPHMHPINRNLCERYAAKWSKQEAGHVEQLVSGVLRRH